MQKRLAAGAKCRRENTLESSLCKQILEMGDHTKSRWASCPASGKRPFSCITRCCFLLTPDDRLLPTRLRAPVRPSALRLPVILSPLHKSFHAAYTRLTRIAPASRPTPQVSTGTINAFLEQFSGELPPDMHVAMVLDRAGWHTASALGLPSNVTLVLLPPKSPELNPAENLWHDLAATTGLTGCMEVGRTSRTPR